MQRVEVRKQILTCSACSLRASCQSPVPFRGPSPARILVLGEAPGRQEDNETRPFVGPSGKLAEYYLERAGLAPETVAWANAVCCFPNRAPTTAEIRACSHNLAAQFQAIRPEYVLVLGGVALSVFWNLRIGVLRGKWWKATVEGLDYRPWFLATWHPAAILRNRTLDAEARGDVMRFSVVSKAGLQPKLPFLCVECGQIMAVLRDNTGRDVSDVVGEGSDGALAWCQKHDDFRMGKAGKGRTAAKKAAKTVKKAEGLF